MIEHNATSVTSAGGRTTLLVILASAGALSMAGCPVDGGGGLADAPKTIQVRFGTFDIGSDDCEDIFSFGDFTVQMRIVVRPSGAEVFSSSQFAELGSAAFQADEQSIDINETAEFELQPDEQFEVTVTITEDDPINSDEPQPWSESDTYDSLTVRSETVTLTNGPGCFRDDRLEYDIVVVTP